jgi:hypothetical protein
MSKPAVGVVFIVDFKHFGIEPVQVLEKKTFDNGQTKYLVRGKWDKRSKWVHSLFVGETLEDAKTMVLEFLKHRIKTIQRYQFDEENFFLYELS